MTYQRITTQADKINMATNNKAELIRSALIAKAAVRMADGAIRIITVQELSTRYEFYNVYKTPAKTARAPRKGWKSIGHFGRDINAITKQYTDFKSFVEYYARVNSATVLSMPLHKNRRLAALYIQTTHESCTSDWSPVVNSTDPRDFRKLNTRLDRAISGRTVDLSWRGK